MFSPFNPFDETGLDKELTLQNTSLESVNILDIYEYLSFNPTIVHCSNADIVDSFNLIFNSIKDFLQFGNLSTVLNTFIYSEYELVIRIIVVALVLGLYLFEYEYQTNFLVVLRRISRTTFWLFFSSHMKTFRNKLTTARFHVVIFWVRYSALINLLIMVIVTIVLKLYGFSSIPPVNESASDFSLSTTASVTTEGENNTNFTVLTQAQPIIAINEKKESYLDQEEVILGGNILEKDSSDWLSWMKKNPLYVVMGVAVVFSLLLLYVKYGKGDPDPTPNPAALPEPSANPSPLVEPSVNPSPLAEEMCDNIIELAESYHFNTVFDTIATTVAELPMESAKLTIKPLGKIITYLRELDSLDPVHLANNPNHLAYLTRLRDHMLGLLEVFQDSIVYVSMTEIINILNRILGDM